MLRAEGEYVSFTGNTVSYTGSINKNFENNVFYCVDSITELIDNDFTIVMPTDETGLGSDFIAETEGFLFIGGMTFAEKNKVDFTVTGTTEETDVICVYAFEIKTSNPFVSLALARGSDGTEEEEDPYGQSAILIDNKIAVHIRTDCENLVYGMKLETTGCFVTGNEIDITGELATAISINFSDPVTDNDIFGMRSNSCISNNTISLNVSEGNGIYLDGYGWQSEDPLSVMIEKNKITGNGSTGIILVPGLAYEYKVKENTIDLPGSSDEKPNENCTGIILFVKEGGKVNATLVEGNQITVKGTGINCLAPAEIKKNNIKAGGEYSVIAYKKMESDKISSPDGDGEVLETNYEAVIMNNTLASKDKKGNESVLYDNERVYVADNGEYVEPKAQEPDPVNPTPVDPENKGDNKDNVKPGGSDTPVTPVVQKKAAKLTAKNKTFKPGAKQKYTVKLKSGKKAIKKAKITLKIGKKKYTVKTNKKGQATFNLKLGKGTYKAKVAFAGNKTYKAASKKVKIIVE